MRANNRAINSTRIVGPNSTMVRNLAQTVETGLNYDEDCLRRMPMTRPTHSGRPRPRWASNKRS